MARLDRQVVLENAANRALVIQDILGELSPDVLNRSFLFDLFKRHQPNAVVDGINTATAFAYQDVFQSARMLLDAARSGPVSREQAERHVLTLTMPQLIRHVQIINEALRVCRAQAYVKIGTSGTGDGAQRALHPFGGAALAAAVDQAGRCRRPLLITVPGRTDTRRARDRRDQAHRHHRLAGGFPSGRSGARSSRLPGSIVPSHYRWIVLSSLMLRGGATPGRQSNRSTSTSAKTATSPAKSSRLSPRWARWS